MNENGPSNRFTDSLPTWEIGPIIALADFPVIFEDLGQEEMGESMTHSISTSNLYFGIRWHLSKAPTYEVYSNLDMHYHPCNSAAYVSADVMVVVPFKPLSQNLDRYCLGVDGPAPMLVTEVLSERSVQQYDLTLKPKIYSKIEVPEFLLVDPSGDFLPQRLLMRRLQPDGSWLDSQDGDGGVTSDLGFRVMFDRDGQARVVDAATGYRYPTPYEATSRVRYLDEAPQRDEAFTREANEAAREAKAKTLGIEADIKRLEEERRIAVQRTEELEAEIARLKARIAETTR